jgi:hypothetical protein
MIDKAEACDPTATNTLSKSGEFRCGACFQRLEIGIKVVEQGFGAPGRRVVVGRHGAASGSKGPPTRTLSAFVSQYKRPVTG